MSGESSSVKRYDADFKKIPGTLSITAAAIAWVPKTPGAMDRQSQALNRAMGTFSYLIHGFQLKLQQCSHRKLLQPKYH
jgi:hypothetical protein